MAQVIPLETCAILFVDQKRFDERYCPSGSIRHRHLVVGHHQADRRLVGDHPADRRLVVDPRELLRKERCRTEDFHRCLLEILVSSHCSP